uniref:Uncharacterized protein n=2 Tax=Acrobeloides nanus TaxID=290746 RepID=A0A914EDS3_9BILA
MYAPTTEVITTEPEKIQHMHYSTSMPSSSTPPIQTKQGNLDQVAYIQSHEQSSRPREKIQEDNGCCASSACCGSANAGDNSCLDLCLVCLFFECLRT